MCIIHRHTGITYTIPYGSSMIEEASRTFSGSTAASIARGNMGKSYTTQWSLNIAIENDHRHIRCNPIDGMITQFINTEKTTLR